MAVYPCRCYVNTDESGRELVNHGTSDFPVACYHAVEDPDPVPPHWHNEVEIIVETRGELNLLVQTKNHLLHEGEGIFINANILHAATKVSKETDFHSLVFSPALVAGSEESIFWTKYVAPVLTNTSLPYLFLTRKIPWQGQFLESAGQAWDAARDEGEGYELIMRSELSACFFLLSRNLASCSSEEFPGDSRQQRLKTMLTYINTHYSEAITLEEIAASASVSTTECLRCFREGLKTSPMQYTRKYRLIVAAKYLKTTDWPVSEIGRCCGFQEMGYFASQFRRLFGCTPSAYRKNG